MRNVAVWDLIVYPWAHTFSLYVEGMLRNHIISQRCRVTEALEQKLMDIRLKYLPASGSEGLMSPLTIRISPLLVSPWRRT